MKIKNTFSIIILVFSIFFSFSLLKGSLGESADLILLNGKIVTLEKSLPQCRAIAIKGDRIIALGDNLEIQFYMDPSTVVIDLGGKLVIPGIVESHGHFISLGYARMRLELAKANNWDDVMRMVSEAAQKAKPGEWILGRGWHQEKWDKTPEPNMEGLPIHNNLSTLTPKNPVLLTHASGHSCFANARAMALAGITGKTPNPPGGEIVKDKDGNPIGVFRETAMGLLRSKLGEAEASRSAAERKSLEIKAIQLAGKECLSYGITTFHDAGVSFDTVDLYKELAVKGQLPLRLYVMIGESNKALREKIADYKIIGMGDNFLTVRAIKRLIDGALGSHGAWLLAPYESLPTSVGLNTEEIEYMKETAKIAIEKGFQLGTHAIGDRANRETLDIYEAAFRAHLEKKNLRWRIEHAQHLTGKDIPRFGKLGVIAAMQGIHCTSDGPWVYKRLGKKRAEEGAYVWRKLMDTGAIISNGTDVPVEDVNPFACFYATVSRKLKDGSLFFPGQKMTPMEALRSYTINGAYAGFEEEIKGSLAPGKLADLVVLSQDILTIPEDKIPSTHVLYTILGGKIVYQR